MVRESNSKKDCFAYKNETITNGCIALKKLYCRNENCIFYKRKGRENNEQ